MKLIVRCSLNCVQLGHNNYWWENIEQNILSDISLPNKMCVDTFMKYYDEYVGEYVSKNSRNCFFNPRAKYFILRRIYSVLLSRYIHAL